MRIGASARHRSASATASDASSGRDPQSSSQSPFSSMSNLIPSHGRSTNLRNTTSLSDRQLGKPPDTGKANWRNCRKSGGNRHLQISSTRTISASDSGVVLRRDWARGSGLLEQRHSRKESRGRLEVLDLLRENASDKIPASHLQSKCLTAVLRQWDYLPRMEMQGGNGWSESE